VETINGWEIVIGMYTGLLVGWVFFKMMDRAYEDGKKKMHEDQKKLREELENNITR